MTVFETAFSSTSFSSAGSGVPAGMRPDTISRQSRTATRSCSLVFCGGG